jgi:2-polyprenyl-3-methyl-5-hydroxy-6-metoxy-1,4-benzoquinol methylase
MSRNPTALGAIASSFESEYYRSNYRDYAAQNPARKLNFYARYILEHVDATPRLIHDIGCAFGTFLGSLDSTWTIHGSDVSTYAIERAARDHPRGDFRVGDASQEPVFSGPFDVVTAFDVIEHVPDLDRLAGAVDEQLRGGGVFVFVVPVYDGLSGPIIRRLDHDPTHIHKWARRRWLSWASSHFDLLDWTGIIRYLLPTRHYLHHVSRRMRNHSPAIIVACRKRTTKDH